MFFFGQNLKIRHKVILCLAALGILINCWVCTKMPVGTFPYIEFLPNGGFTIHFTHIALAYGALVKMLVIAFFRKF